MAKEDAVSIFTSITKCPACGAVMPKDQYKARKPWICPNCSKQFQLSPTYKQVVALATLAVVVIFFYLLGLRGFRLFVATFVMWFPLLILVTFILNRLIALPLEEYRPKQ
ncbi:MAG TPA: hypothetical protein VGZ48_06180 [Candidatus Acidoferrales bacterium]|nr:hypothetical protein [Candidatus Acidoferrales bacterium]